MCFVNSLLMSLATQAALTPSCVCLAIRRQQHLIQFIHAQYQDEFSIVGLGNPEFLDRMRETPLAYFVCDRRVAQGESATLTR